MSADFTDLESKPRGELIGIIRLQQMYLRGQNRLLEELRTQLGGPSEEEAKAAKASYRAFRDGRRSDIEVLT